VKAFQEGKIRDEKELRKLRDLASTHQADIQRVRMSTEQALTEQSERFEAKMTLEFQQLLSELTRKRAEAETQLERAEVQLETRKKDLDRANLSRSQLVGQNRKLREGTESLLQTMKDLKAQNDSCERSVVNLKQQLARRPKETQ
jgi:hypothetical protein